jgi:peptidoglycan/xylan/chitin deacetylase (PgdA/CDA1 family)
MDMNHSAPSPLLPVVKLALLCACASLALVMIDEALCVLPLAVFVSSCLAAPFLPRYGFFLPVISRGCTGKNMVALTFDDGPDPATTPRLLELLEKYKAKAAFFVIGEKAQRHPELMREIIACGHAVGNHSYSHDVLLMLRARRTLASEIRRAQQAMIAFGIQPLVFRPPAGITNPKLGSLLRRLGLQCVTFSCRGFDAGNRRIHGLADRILRKVRPDDILLLHDCMPRGPATVDLWLEEVEALLAGLAEKNLAPAPLEQLIGSPVCSRLTDKALKMGRL